MDISTNDLVSNDLCEDQCEEYSDADQCEEYTDDDHCEPEPKAKIPTIERLKRVLYTDPNARFAPDEIFSVATDMSVRDNIKALPFPVPLDLATMFAWEEFPDVVYERTALDVAMPPSIEKDKNGQEWTLLANPPEDMKYATVIAVDANNEFCYVVAWKADWVEGSGLMYYGKCEDYERYLYYVDHPEELVLKSDEDGFVSGKMFSKKSRRKVQQKGRFKLSRLPGNLTFADFLIVTTRVMGDENAQGM